MSKGVAVACSQSWFCGLFFQCLWTNSPQWICLFCFKINQYTQMMVLNKHCALCDCTLKGVAMAFRQSWFCGLFFQSLWTNSPQGIYQFCFKISQYSLNMVLIKRCALCDSTSKGVSVVCCQSWPFLIECQTVMPFVPFPNPNVSYYESPCDRPSLPHTAWAAAPPTCRNIIHDMPRRTRRGPAHSSLEL